MTKAILLQVLEDKRVQRLVIAAVKMKEEYPLVNEKNVIQEMKKELGYINNTASKWVQTALQI